MGLPEKLIVMPLVPARGQEYNGTGLGIHFLIGNMMAVHDALTEFWFGWRVNKLFPQKKMLKEYCRGNTPDLDYYSLGQEQGIRYWLSGDYKEQQETVAIRLELTDAQTKQTHSCELTMDLNNGFKGFYKEFFRWFDTCGLPFSNEQAQKASWQEMITVQGFDFLGQAIAVTYNNYIDGAGAIDIQNFEKSIASSPDSFLAHDLYAWALYKNQAYAQAEKSFHTSLKYNENGMGAIAGLMWCAIFKKDENQAYAYALAKANVRNDDPDKARTFVSKKFEG